MHVACLCPTYGRPSLVRNAMACFVHQRLQGHTAELWILDDAGQIASQSGGRPGQRWHIISEAERYQTLPAKYARLIELAGSDAEAVIVWDDDDVYLPWHIATHANVMDTTRWTKYHGTAGPSGPYMPGGAAWSHPSQVYSTYGRRSVDEPPAIESARGRFHGALAIRRDLLDTIGGWVQTDRATFDQEMIAVLRTHATPGDPCILNAPSYVYRWADTGHHHCSGVMDRADWYQLTPIEEPGQVDECVPVYDASTRQILSALRLD